MFKISIAHDDGPYHKIIWVTLKDVPTFDEALTEALSVRDQYRKHHPSADIVQITLLPN